MSFDLIIRKFIQATTILSCTLTMFTCTLLASVLLWNVQLKHEEIAFPLVLIGIFFTVEILYMCVGIIIMWPFLKAKRSFIRLTRILDFSKPSLSWEELQESAIKILKEKIEFFFKDKEKLEYLTLDIKKRAIPLIRLYELLSSAGLLKGMSLKDIVDETDASRPQT